jgi:hypothetical protein
VTDRAAVVAGYRRNEAELHALLAGASRSDLARRSNGTRWTNEELLFHMVFGYMVVRALLPLVRATSRMPPRLGRGFTGLLNAGSVPFDAVNYWGSRFATVYFTRTRMAGKLARTQRALLRRLESEPEANLHRGMPFPTRWDPFFTSFMTLGEVYAYPIQHFDFHRKQLSL